MSTLTLKPALIIPDHLIGEVRSKMAYVDEAITAADISAAGDQITLSLSSAIDSARAAEVESKVQRVVETMVKGAFKPKVQVLEDFSQRPIHYTEDPNAELIARGEMHQEATGIFALGPTVTKLINFFESKFLWLADSFGAQPHRFPTLIPAKYLERVGYFSAFPQSLTFVQHLREDLDVIDNFSKTAALNASGLNTPSNSFSPIQTLLSPAVCYHLYFSLADKPLPNGQVVATAVGNCFRYESTNLTSLERLWNFTMREVIFVGSKDFVLQNRETSRERMRGVFEEIGLVYHVETANDPFFIGEFRKQAAFQSAFQLKFEIRAKLPFKDPHPGPLPKGERGATLAVGSYNYHQDFFGRTLNITLPDGAPAHTGCTAFGLERMAYAFLAQYGFDQRQWPEVVRKVMA